MQAHNPLHSASGEVQTSEGQRREDFENLDAQAACEEVSEFLKVKKERADTKTKTIPRHHQTAVTSGESELSKKTHGTFSPCKDLRRRKKIRNKKLSSLDFYSPRVQEIRSVFFIVHIFSFIEHRDENGNVGLLSRGFLALRL